MKYLLDTNICIYIIKQKPQLVLNRFANISPLDIGVSTITVAELEFGVQKSLHPQQNRSALQKFLSPLNIYDFDTNASMLYGILRAKLESKGTTIGSLDMLIAAHALSLDFTLVTNNEKEFNRIDKLLIENWAI